MRSAPTYYIEIDTYWANSPSHFVGPFESKRKATDWFDGHPWKREDNTWLSTSTCGGDIKTAWRIWTKPLSKTEARKHGLWSYKLHDDQDNTIPPRIPPVAKCLDAYVCEDDIVP